MNTLQALKRVIGCSLGLLEVARKKSRPLRTHAPAVRLLPGGSCTANTFGTSYRGKPSDKLASFWNLFRQADSALLPGVEKNQAGNLAGA